MYNVIINVWSLANIFCFTTSVNCEDYRITTSIWLCVSYPGMRGPHCAHLVSWNCFGSHVSVCVHVCVHVHACVCVCLRLCVCPKYIDNQEHVWCDIDHVWLVKQVLLLFPPAISCFIWHFPSIKWMSLALLTQHVMNACQRRLKF